MRRGCSEFRGSWSFRVPSYLNTKEINCPKILRYSQESLITSGCGESRWVFPSVVLVWTNTHKISLCKICLSVLIEISWFQFLTLLSCNIPWDGSSGPYCCEMSPQRCLGFQHINQNSGTRWVSQRDTTAAPAPYISVPVKEGCRPFDPHFSWNSWKIQRYKKRLSSPQEA